MAFPTFFAQVLDHLHLQGDQVRHALEAALAGGLGAGERLLSAARGNNFQAPGSERRLEGDTAMEIYGKWRKTMGKPWENGDYR